MDSVHPIDPIGCHLEEEVCAKENDDVEIDWFEGVTKILPASTSMKQGGLHAEDAVFFEDLVKKDEYSPKVGVDSESTFRAERGFHDTNVVLTEAKAQQKHLFLGSGVLLQNPSTWSSVDESPRRFVVTAAHCVCSAQYNKITMYDPIRLRIPIKPWKNFPEDDQKYRHGAGEMKLFYSNIMINPKWIFIHPKYKGEWSSNDIALIAIPSVKPSLGSRIFSLRNPEIHPSSSEVIGFPMKESSGKLFSHMPYVSSRITSRQGELKIELELEGTMVRYHCRTFNGMSGGAVVFDDRIIGLHTAGDSLDLECGNGLVFTKSLVQWMEDVCLKWEALNLGEHQLDNGLSKELHAACRLFDFEQVKEFLSNGANPSWRDKNGCTPAWTCASLEPTNGNKITGHVKCMDMLVEKGANLTMSDENIGYAPIHLASKNGNLKILKLLADKVNLNTQNKIGSTPACIAAFYGHLDCLVFLHSSGADLTISNKFGLTPIHAAAQEGKLMSLTFLADKVDVNILTKQGGTPAFFAAYRGHLECLALLHERNADLTTPNQDGHAPMHAVAWQGKLTCLTFLADKVDVNIRTKKGKTPAFLAASHGHSECLALLHERNADLTTPNQDGHAPIHAAAQEGKLMCLTFLADKVDVNIQSKKGTIPAYFAASNGHLECLVLLHERNADLTIPDQNGYAPVHAAAQGGNLTCLTFLADKVDLETPVNTGSVFSLLTSSLNPFTPAKIAQSKGHQQCVEFIVKSLKGEKRI